MVSKVLVKPVANGVHKSTSANVFCMACVDKFGDELHLIPLRRRVYLS